MILGGVLVAGGVDETEAGVEAHAEGVEVQENLDRERLEEGGVDVDEVTDRSLRRLQHRLRDGVGVELHHHEEVEEDPGHEGLLLPPLPLPTLGLGWEELSGLGRNHSVSRAGKVP